MQDYNLDYYMDLWITQDRPTQYNTFVEDEYDEPYDEPFGGEIIYTNRKGC